MDLVRPAVVHAECRPVSQRSDRQGGTERGDPADAGRFPRDLINHRAREVESIDVADLSGVGDEVEAAAVARPVRIDVLGRRDAWQLPDGVRLDVDRGETEIAERQRVERRGESIGRKRNRAAVRRPRRLQIGKRVTGQGAHGGCVQIQFEQIAQPAPESGERDPLAVRRPRWSKHLIGFVDWHLALDAAGLHVENRQHRLAARPGGQRETAAGRVPGAGRLDELQALEVRIARRLDDLALDRARHRIRQIHVDRVLIALREKHHRLAVGAERRTDVQSAAIPARHESRRHPRRRCVAARRRQHRPDGFMPASDRAALGFRLQTPCDNVLAEAARQIRPQRLSVAIRKPARISQLVDPRQLILSCGIAQPHRRIRIDASNRQVLRHAFDEPQGQRRHRPAALAQDLALKRVNELVSQDVVGFSEPRGKRKHDAALLVLGHAADALAEETRNHVGLGELRVARVQHDRLARGKGEAERGRQPGVPALGKPACLDRGVVLRRVVVNIEVRALEDPEVEIVVVHLVAAERLRAGRACRRHDRGEREAGNSDQHKTLSSIGCGSRRSR